MSLISFETKINGLEVKTAGLSDRDDWNQFVDAHEDGWLHHVYDWKTVIETAYSYSCFYLMARRGQEVVGLMPLVLVDSRLFGRSLTSVPYLDSAGPLALDEDSRSALLQAASKLALREKVRYTEIRDMKKLPGQYNIDTSKVTLMLELEADSESMWKALSSERRNRIKKAQKANLTTEICGLEALDQFYSVWTQNMRDLGSPPHSRSFFESIGQNMHDSFRIILVKHSNVCIGAAVCLYYKDRFALPWVSSLRKYFALYPNNILYWDAICFGIDRGCHWFDFGRSSVGSGTYKFKTRWKAKPQQLYWHFETPDGKPMEPATSGSKYELAVTLWKRLPVGLTRLIGPAIRKQITA